MTKIRVHNSESTFQEAVVTSIHSRILKKNREGKIFRLALSGGSTPVSLYEALSQLTDIDWSLVELYLVDERYVPLSDEKSNQGMIQKTLIERLQQKPAKFVFFDTAFSIQEALEKYQQELDSSDSPFFDLVLLGIGTDGHTASLFPGSAALKETKHWLAHTETKKNDIKDRLTMTYPALESAQEIFFLIRGHQKKSILDQVESSAKNNLKIPAARLFHRENAQVFFADL